jgi:uncharacterized protein YprB with RNaseH-like and TPR domain
MWKGGCIDWTTYLRHPKKYPVGSAGRVKTQECLEQSIVALSERNHQFFAPLLGTKEVWRAWPEFSDRVVYLDIETDGGSSAESITMVGLYDGQNFRCLIKGIDLWEFPDVISQYGMIVTFFGQAFDIPVLQKAFPKVPFDQMHLDLCFALKRVGIRGGLKKIEQKMGIERSSRTQGLTGRDAVRLWREYMYGRDHSLETLIDYNREDVVNLQTLAAIAYDRLRREKLREVGLTEAHFAEDQACLF